ncbi:WYL domain-containing protein [Salinibacterium sp. ZJ454]|uniref:helix-turn-helix transcriptional regulator n=1 Tax=Salinibacterium sp. ZJ454 TaxID=2708339 RepID=UPI00141F45AD|nr:WYL domain-containing protein [Salinibacterium sp. ZJ454]
MHVVTASQARVPVEERLFSLVLALLASDSGLTKNEILSTVQGYRQKYRAAGDNANLERQFERDKDDIRELGVPLETIEAPDDPGNNQAMRYRIPRGSYELPEDITFSAEETALLNLAAMVWREGSLSGESRRALIKLRGLGVNTTDPVLGYAPRVRVRDAAFEPLNTASEKRGVVKFDYLKPGEAEARTRSVLPLALVQHQGRWHLYAEEADTGNTRTFLLRRIVSKVVASSKTFAARPGDQSALALAGLDEVWQRNVAELEITPGTDAATRLQKRRGAEPTDSGALRMHFTDLNIFADELAGYGPEVLVLSPPELRDAVRNRLILTAVNHG